MRRGLATSRKCLALALAVGFLSPGAQGANQGTPSNGAEASLVEIVELAKQQFSPPTPARVATARHRVVEATGQLEAYLSQGSKENTDRWKDYLRWRDMVGELEQGERPNLRKLSRAAARYFHNQPGLEQPLFTDVRDALVAYRDRVEAMANGALEEQYQEHLDELIQLLPAFATSPNPSSRQKIVQILDWLKRAGQGESVIAAVRRRYHHPNLIARISESLAASGLQNTVERQKSVRDCILGTTLVGQATIKGRTDLRMIDDPAGATLHLQMAGTIHSVNTGYNRGVTIYSQGVTSVEVRKPIFLRANDITWDSASANCRTRSTITGICAKSCLVRRIASKRAARSKSHAETIASRHAEQSAAREMDEEAEQRLAKAHNTYQEKFRNLLIRRGEFPRELSFRTASAALHIVWRQANASQLAAPTPPPEIAAENDLAVRLHESFVGNFSRALIGGFTLTDERLAEILEENTGKVPDELKVRTDREPWSITFASEQPVSAVFSNNTIRFAIRGRRFTLGNRVVSKTLEMSAAYKLEKTPAGTHLTRLGDVSAQYIGNEGRVSSTQVLVRAVMKTKFEAVFAPEFNTDGIMLPGQWKKGGRLHLEHLYSDNGWLALAWLKQVALPAQEAQSRQDTQPEKVAQRD